MRKIWILLLAILFPLAVMAQGAAEISQQESDDRGFLTRMLERNLSSDDRTVIVEGFNGALSSRATFTRITIADGDGVWLTISDGAIQWNRTALLRGRVDIAEMTARQIDLPRLPGQSEDLPRAETREFSLPELPVAINIAQIRADRVNLGQPVIGIEAAIGISGSMSLAGGEGAAQLTIDRMDGPRGQFTLDAGYSNETGILRLNLDLDEEPDGLLVNLVGLYGKPSVTARISGEGAIRDFAADIELATDGEPRVSGQISANAGTGTDGSPGTNFRLELGGDVAALLPPDDRAFFGSDTRLVAQGWRGDDGRLELPQLELVTDALSVDGSLSLTGQGAPQTAELSIRLGRDAGATQVPVALPFGGSMVESGRLQLDYDAATGGGWTLTGFVGALASEGVLISTLTLDGAGQVLLDQTALSSVNGHITFSAAGMEFDNPGLAEAIGTAVEGSANIDFTPGNAVDVSDLTVNGSDFGLDGNFLISGLGSGFVISVDATAHYEDLSRLSTLADRPLQGRGDLVVQGYYNVLTRSFDIDAELRGTDIALDQPQLDRLLAGESRIALRARRDWTGIEIEDFSINAQRLSAEAQGYLNSYASDVTARISMPSLGDADPDYSGSLEARAHVTGPRHGRRLAISGVADDLRIGIETLDNALQGRTELDIVAGEKNGDGFQIETLRLANPQLTAEAEGSFVAGALNAVADVSVANLAVLNAGWAGGFTARAQIREEDGTRFLDMTGEGENLSFGVADTDGALTGTTRLIVQAEEQQGVVTLRDLRLSNDQVNVTAEGIHGEGVTDLTANIDITSLASFGPGWRGAVRADATFRDRGDGSRRLEIHGTGQNLSFGQAQVDGALAGETRLAITGVERDGVFTIEQAQLENPRLNAQASGRVGGGQSDISGTVNATDLRFLGNGISGSLAANGRLVEENGMRRITASGNANGLALNQPQVDPLLRGQTSFDLAATQSSAGLSFQRLNVRNPQIQIQASGNTAGGLTVDARLSDLGMILPQIPGPVTANGVLREQGPNLAVDMAVTAPGSTRAQIAGTVARDFSTTALTITGNTDAALANSFMPMRSVEGPISLNLTLNGPPGLNALGGQARLSNGRLADPRIGIRIDDLDATADFQNGRIMVDMAGNIADGGRLTLSGPVDLSARTVDLVVILDRVVARDPNLYQTEITGRLTVTGSLVSGPLIAGRIDLGPTELRIPSTGLGGAAEIPDITHVGTQRPPVKATRAKAGLEPFPSDASLAAGMTVAPSAPRNNPPRLDLVINAPNQVFIRGRGVDAEMGGSLQVQGTARNVVPIGHLELIRGRVDLLGKRFTLTEGLVELQGSLIPVLRLVAETDQNGITTRVIIDGEVHNPEITFESSPQLPEEEVLSHLLFGRSLDNISALQAAQLANAVAVLAGHGGVGIIGNLRNRTGLDDLDLQTDSDGNVQVRAGRYLTDNIYTDVTVGSDGRSTINLNLDVTQSLTARGSVGSDGESKLGIYFERDY